MRVRTLSLALVLLCLPAVARAFTFQVPPGWVDLSPGAPPKNFERLPPAVAAELRQGRYAAIAMDLDHAADGFAENFNALVEPGVEPITQPLLDQIAASMGSEIRRQAKDATLKVLERGTVSLHGITCGRMVSDVQMGAMHMRQLVYLLPGEGNHAIVTYSATPATFAQYTPVFTAAIEATQGIVRPLSLLDRILRTALIGAAAGGVAGLVSTLLSRRKKRAAAT